MMKYLDFRLISSKFDICNKISKPFKRLECHPINRVECFLLDNRVLSAVFENDFSYSYRC